MSVFSTMIGFVVLGAVPLTGGSDLARSVSSSRTPVEDVMAIVNGTEVTRRQVDIAYEMDKVRRAQSRVALPPTAEQGIKRRLLEELVNIEVLYQEATDRGLAPAEDAVNEQVTACKSALPGEKALIPPAVVRMMTDAELVTVVERSLALRKLAAQMSAEITVTAEEVRNYYDQNAVRYKTKEQIHARHILIKVASPQDDGKAKERIEAIRKRVEAGEDFAQLARQYSECPSADDGGKLEPFCRGVMAADFERAAFSTLPGDVSAPVRTRFGYHLIKVEKHSQPRQRSFDEVETEITDLLRQLYTDRAIQRLAVKLRVRGNIWVRPPNSGTRR